MGTEEKKVIHWLDWLQFIILAALSPLFIFPKPKYLWLLAIIPILWLFRLIIAKKFLERTPLDIPLMLLFVALVMTGIRATDLQHNLPKIAGLLLGILMFYAIVALLKTESLLKWGSILFMLGGFGFAIIGVLGMPTFKVKHLDFLMAIKDNIPSIDFKLPGAEAGFSTNAVGGTLLLVVPLFFSFLLLSWWKKPDSKLDIQSKKQFPFSPLALFCLTLGLVITGAVLLLTQSRGAWVGLFLATMALAMGMLKFTVKSRRTIVIWIIILVLIILIAGIGIYTVTHAKKLSPGLKQAEGTLQFRIHVWNITVPLIRKNPIWGVGLNNFRTQQEVRYFWSSAHNQFLHVAVEMGIPALIAYLAILIIAGYMIVYVYQMSQILWQRTLALGLGWGQLAFLFFGLTDAIPPGAKVGIFFWLSLALIAALFKYITNNRPSPKQNVPE